MDTRQWMSILLCFATALMLFVAFLSYRKRHLQVARTMIFVMLTAAFYAFGYACEILSDGLQGVKLSLQFEYVGISFISTFWLLLVIQFTGAAARYRKLITILLFIIPSVTFVLHLTNEWHHLIYKDYIRSVNATIPLYTTVKGLWYSVHAVYNYTILLFGILLFIPMYMRALPIVRKQIFVLILGAGAPMLFNIGYMFSKVIDFTPFGFAISGVAYAWGIFRFRLLRLTPLAQAKVFDTIGEGIVLLDYEDQIVNHNHAAEEMFPILGDTKSFPASGKTVLASYPELFTRITEAEGREVRFPFRLQQDERHRHYICSLSFIFDTGIDPIGKMLMFNDITEMKENEERLRENTRRLSQLNTFKDKLFTVVAHDIRDPIAMLVSLTELLEEEPRDDHMAQTEVYQAIRRQVASTFQLVENLLDWYRSQNGGVDFRPSVWSLQQVVRQALSLAGARAGMKRIKLTDLVEESITVNADKAMLDLILRNLLSNAIKYTEIGGKIDIGAYVEGELVHIFIRDDGAGIDEQTARLLRAEEMFFKESGPGSEGSEMRFGLVLAREFVRLHGGSLRFDSVPGVETTFTFTLPISTGGDSSIESNGSGVVEYESHTG